MLNDTRIKFRHLACFLEVAAQRSFVRAAEAFGATGCLFLKGSVSPFNPKSLRATAGICVYLDDATCGYHSREIVVSDGEIVEEVIAQSKKFKADLVVLGTRDGFLTDNRIGQTIKSIIRNSKIPVMVVPPHPN